jgi:drug/metabolite transporter (DMT)-like permease
MLDLTLGIAAAIGSSIFYSLGIAFQATDAKQAPREQYLRAALLLGLLRRSRWLLGTGLTVLGWPLQVLALSLAPLVVVQPALAMGLLVLLVVAERMLGEHAGRTEHIAMAAIVLGVVGAALCAPPLSHTHTSEQGTITLVLLILGLASLIPYGLRLIGHPRPELTMLSAGLAFAWSGIATKLASDDLTTGHTFTAGLWALSTLLASIVGLLSEMSALQERPAIQVAPVVFVTQTLVPVVLAPLLLGERFSDTPFGGIPLALSLAVLLAGAVMLVRSPLLLALTAGERSSEPSGSGRSPSDSSVETMRSRPAREAGEPSSSTTTTSPARS